MSNANVLSTSHLEVVGKSGTVHTDTDPPLLYAEDLHGPAEVRKRSVEPGLNGALQVFPGAVEGRLHFGNFVGLTELDGCLVRVDSRRISVPQADEMLGDLLRSLRRLPSRALPPHWGAAFDRPLGSSEDLDLLAYIVVRDAVRGHGPHDLTAALGRILTRPHEHLIDERIDRPIWSADRVDGATAIDLVARPVPRILVPANSPFSHSPVTLRLNGMLPTRISVGRSVPTTDTLENRFVATVIDRCLAITRAVIVHAAREGLASLQPVHAEAVQVATTLERWRRHRVLENLQPLTRLPTTSTVLRKRPGYRDVLTLYADLLGRTRVVPPAAAMRIVGLRDIATLFEWWCFFQVVDAMASSHGPPLRVDPSLKVGRGPSLAKASRRTSPGVFGSSSIVASRGPLKGGHHSYSVPLRPDILMETPTERHIFDAKFAFEPSGLIQKRIQTILTIQMRDSRVALAAITFTRCTPTATRSTVWRRCRFSTLVKARVVSSWHLEQLASGSGGIAVAGRQQNSSV